MTAIVLRVLYEDTATVGTLVTVISLGIRLELGLWHAAQVAVPLGAALSTLEPAASASGGHLGLVSYHAAHWATYSLVDDTTFGYGDNEGGKEGEGEYSADYASGPQ